MSVHVQILISEECKDIDQANDWTESVKDLLKGNVTGTFHSKISNSSPAEELTQEQESE